jgi:ribosomal-protein-alanine N-acetyltransferase
MREGDLDAVLAVEAVSFPTPWTRGQFVEELAHGHSDPIVAVDEETGALLGYAVTWHVLDESHLLNIAVAPASRGRGVGRTLLKGCIARSARCGSALIRLEVRVGNEHAAALYRDEGFRFDGIRKGYYADTGEDALLFSRDLEGKDGSRTG